MTTKEQRRRLSQLAAALAEIAGMPSSSITDSIRRVLRLVELCPWIEGDEAEELVSELNNRSSQPKVAK